MAWIKMRTDLGDDPRVLKLMVLLRLKDPDFVVGKLHRFWGYIDQHTTDGKLPHLTAELVDHQMRMRGFAEAMVTVGWLEFDEMGATVPRFDEHNSETAKKRAQAAKRQERHRVNGEKPPGPPPNGGEKSPKSNANSNATSVTPALRERQQPRYLEKDSEKEEDKELRSRSQKILSVGEILQPQGTARNPRSQKPTPEELLQQTSAPMTATQQQSFLLLAENLPDADTNLGQVVTVAVALPFADVFEAVSEWKESRSSPNPLENQSANLIDKLERKAADRGLRLWRGRKAAQRASPHAACAQPRSAAEA